MSAYVVDRAHIAALVHYAMKHRGPGSGMSWVWNVDREKGTYERNTLNPGQYSEATRLGQMLWEENIKSVCHRYDDVGPDLDNIPGPIGETFVFEYKPTLTPMPSPVAILKACDGYEYQACEHAGWDTSEAKAFINALRSRAIYDLPGYDDAAWEIAA